MFGFIKVTYYDGSSKWMTKRAFKRECEGTKKKIKWLKENTPFVNIRGR